MLSDNNILAFIFSVLPALIYGYIIYIHAPKNSIKLKKLWIYTIIGFLSITFFTFFTFMFPNFQDPLFREFLGIFYRNGKFDMIYEDTFFTVLFFAFIQVALLEEFCKWITFKTGGLIRGRNVLRDNPYAIMFYMTMIAAGFASFENVQYAIKAINGRFGVDMTVNGLLLVRSLSSVVLHMVCGVILGYYVAVGAKSKLSDRIKLNIFGILLATFTHGLYDFLLMYEPTSVLTINVFSLDLHWPSMIIIVVGVAVAYFLAKDLKNKKISRKKKTQSNSDIKSDSLTNSEI
jgi:RsiW-degrading membrane proteinase PrsW (M82 family)